MKPPPNFKKKSAAPSLGDQLAQHKDSIVELGLELEQLKHELSEKLKVRVKNAGEEAKDHIFSIAREHFQGREDAILAKLHAFIAQPIFWEHSTLWGSSSTTGAVQELVRQGYTYCHTVYDPDAKDVTRRHGSIYRRPKIPETFGEFKELYSSFVLVTAESKQKRKELLAKREAAAAKVESEVDSALRKKRKLAKAKASDEA
jgi:hypothetical protein